MKPDGNYYGTSNGIVDEETLKQDCNGNIEDTKREELATEEIEQSVDLKVANESSGKM